MNEFFTSTNDTLLGANPDNPEQSGSELATNDEMPLGEAATLVTELDQLTGKIIEYYHELEEKEQLRQRVQEIFRLLGVTGYTDPRYREILMRLYNPTAYLKTPKEYPTFPEFQAKLESWIANGKKPPESDCTTAPGVLSVAKFARLDVTKIDKRSGQTLEEYLYELGKVMIDPYTYRYIFHDDPIIIRDDWSVANGRHRVAVIKSLPEEILNIMAIEIQKDPTGFRDER